MRQFPNTSFLLAVATLLAIPSFASAEDAPVQLLESGAVVKKLAGNMKFTEGPVWLPAENKVVFSDIPNSKLMQWSEADGLSEFRPSKNANGNIIDPKGRIISCQHSGRNLIRIEPDGAETVLVDRFEGKRFNSPNDVAMHSDGSLWFTDPPWGLWGSGKDAEIPGHWVFKWDPKSKQTKAIVKDLAMPNGIVFSPDESRIYIADTGGHPKHPDEAMQKLKGGVHVYEMNKDANGASELGKKLMVIPGGSDGMAVDVQGNIYTTHRGAVHAFSSDGKSLGAIKVPEGPANVCFGGEDFKTLFITARTSLYSVRMKNAGAKTPRAP